MGYERQALKIGSLEIRFEPVIYVSAQKLCAQLEKNMPMLMALDTRSRVQNSQTLIDAFYHSGMDLSHIHRHHTE